MEDFCLYIIHEEVHLVERQYPKHILPKAKSVEKTYTSPEATINKAHAGHIYKKG